MTLTAVPGIKVGHAHVPGAESGCTVVLGPFRGAVEVRGMATGSRELGVLSPYHLVDQVNAILLTGGSAFGLASADGVVRWLEERGEGFDTGIAPVPLVPAAVIFDLRPEVPRPGPTEGRAAAAAASAAPVEEGRVGAGATVGKLRGPLLASKGGIGSVSGEWGGGTMGALAVVNALGDVLALDGTILAGLKRPDGGFQRSDLAALEEGDPAEGMPGTNTTLVVLATDLPLSRIELGRVAKTAAGGIPRAISPVHTPFDGDMVFSLSTGGRGPSPSSRDALALGVMARELTEEAIRRAVTQGEAQEEPARSSGGSVS